MKIYNTQIIDKFAKPILMLTCCFIMLTGFKHKPSASNTQNKVGLPDIVKSDISKPELDIQPDIPEKEKVLEDEEDITEDTQEAPKIPKPDILNPIPFASTEPLASLDQLVIKQFVRAKPYIPIIQEITIGLECMNLLKNTWLAIKNIKKTNYNKSHEYSANISAIFRHNIQASIEAGYVKLFPDHLKNNKYKYKVMGFYGGVGLDYLSRYSESDNVYIGLRYNKAYFTNHTLPDKPNLQNIIQKLNASWVELVLGFESRLLANISLYGGCVIRMAYLYDFDKFSPASNYVIPGYGLNANKFRPALNLYILYKFSFIEKMIKFN